MTILTINTGTSPNSGDGDSLRTAFNKINANFAYLSTATAGGTTGTGTANLGDIDITNNVITTKNVNQNIIFDPNGIGKVSFKNTAIQFDNGSGAGPGAEFQLLQTRGSGTPVGLGLDAGNSSLRIVGDKQQLGTLADFGLYDGLLDSWASRFLISHNGTITATGDVNIQGNIVLNKTIRASGVTATGIISALGGIRFNDGTTLTTAVSALTISSVTSGTQYSNTVTNVNALRFDTDSGFTVIDHGQGTVEIAMNSTFKYWHVDGQQTLVAEGLDHVRFVAGNGINIETNTTTDIKSIIFNATAVYGGSLGNLIVDSTSLYPNNTALGVGIGNADINSGTVGVSYLSIPSKGDIVSPLVFSSPNEVRITTSVGSENPITIAPNQDGTGPGYVAIGGTNSTATAGVFLFSAAANVDLWPNQTVPQNFYGSSLVGALDLNTTGNNNISIRPGGTGTVVVTSNLAISGAPILGTNNPGAGTTSVTSATYRLLATLLNVNTPVHKIGDGNYYLPPGQEGQLAYFAPTSGTQLTQTQFVWSDRIRIVSTSTGLTATVVTLSNAKWTPLVNGNPAGSGISFAIYLDGAWQPHQSFVS